jgi:hypothetical protein
VVQDHVLDLIIFGTPAGLYFLLSPIRNLTRRDEQDMDQSNRLSMILDRAILLLLLVLVLLLICNRFQLALGPVNIKIVKVTHFLLALALLVLVRGLLGRFGLAGPFRPSARWRMIFMRLLEV